MRLLRFVVDETLRGQGAQLKETRLGLEVFGRRAESYDAAIDPIVRVQMGRLRARLRAYYERPGAADPVIIEVPPGSYVPVFRLREAAKRQSADATGPAHRIAVLPFLNLSDAPASDYFSDGLTEELINLLARDRRLHVVARTSTFQFKGVARDARDIGRQLGAGKILEGSVRQVGTRVRITAQLIDVTDGCELWSERFDREITDIFAIQEEIAGAILGALRARISEVGTPLSPARRDGTLEAYNHYLQGRFLWNKRTEQGLRGALTHFADAVRLDPTYARAYSGLADCYLMLGMSAADAPEQCMPQARSAAQTALELDDGLAEAHTSIAAVLNCYDRRRSAAEAGYHRAEALDASYATTRHWNGFFNLATAGRLTEAVRELETAVALDPLSPPILCDLGLVQCFAGNHHAADAQYAKTLEIAPHFHRPFWFRGLCLAARGECAAAEAALQEGLRLCPDYAFRSRLLGTLGYCYGRWNKPRRAATVLRQLEEIAATRYVPRFDLAQLHAGGTARDTALAELAAAVEANESYAIFLKIWPAFQELRTHPQFGALVQRLDRVP